MGREAYGLRRPLQLPPTGLIRSYRRRRARDGLGIVLWSQPWHQGAPLSSEFCPKAGIGEQGSQALETGVPRIPGADRLPNLLGWAFIGPPPRRVTEAVDVRWATALRGLMFTEPGQRASFLYPRNSKSMPKFPAITIKPNIVAAVLSKTRIGGAAGS